MILTNKSVKLVIKTWNFRQLSQIKHYQTPKSRASDLKKMKNRLLVPREEKWLYFLSHTHISHTWTYTYRTRAHAATEGEVSKWVRCPQQEHLGVQYLAQGHLGISLPFIVCDISLPHRRMIFILTLLCPWVLECCSKSCSESWWRFRASSSQTHLKTSEDLLINSATYCRYNCIKDYIPHMNFCEVFVPAITSKR